MINSANKYTIAGIFPVEKSLKYVIPKFQREYTWTKENWEELLNDIWESDGNHFIGSIICINRGVDSLEAIELELIDGQQRLTTVSLLFCSIYKLLNKSIINADDDLKLELGNLKYRLVQRKEKNELKIELSHQNNNFSDYKAVLNDIGVIDFSEEIKNKGNRRIFKAYKYFLSKLEDKNNKELLDLLEKINNTLLVKIEVSSHSDAFMLFESLNNRGVPLSAIDLIKNKMLAELEKREAISIDDAFLKWSELIKKLPEYPIQERFLRQFYNAFKFDSKIKVEKITKATRSNLIKIYENLIEKDPEFIFDKLFKKSLIYHDLIFPNEAEKTEINELASELKDLAYVQAAPSYIFLLYLFSKEDKLDKEFYREVIKFLVNYFIRRNVTDFPNTRNLDQIFIDLIEEMEKDKNKMAMEFIVKFMTNDIRMSSMETFVEKLKGDLYELNIDATRFILSKIEEIKQTREIYLDFWERDKSNKLVWTVEHIFPEGTNIPKPWVDMIANGDEIKAAKIQEKYVHKLGNLTLTGYNQSLSNFEFEKKRDRKDRKDNNIGYKNGLFLNENLKNKTKWTKDDIINRTEKLVETAKDIFQIEGK